MIKIRLFADIEREAIEDAVAITGSVLDGARALGLGKMTVYRRMKEYAKLPPRENRVKLPPVRNDPKLVQEVERLRQEVEEWKSRYDALSRLGRAARDYFDESNPTSIGTARGKTLRRRR